MSKKSILLLVILFVIIITNITFLPNAIINSSNKEGLDYTINRTVVNETDNKDESVKNTDKKSKKRSKKKKKNNHNTKKNKHKKNKHKKHKKHKKTYKRKNHNNNYSSRGGYTISCLATAYCGCSQCSEGWGTMTATGRHAVSGRTIAVDPSVIPLGSRVIINGHTYVAEDTGGGVKGNHVDIFMDNHSSTYNWGARRVQVTILR